MSLLLDTCTLIWLGHDKELVPPGVLERIAEKHTPVFVSPVSVYEMAVKHAAGKLKLNCEPLEFVRVVRDAFGFDPLPFEEDACKYLGRLPTLHADPFDRMLICQALHHGLTIVTPDHRIKQYAVPVLW